MAEKQQKILKVDRIYTVILDSHESGERTARIFVADENVPTLIVYQPIAENGKFLDNTEALPDSITVFTKVEEFKQIAFAHLLAGVIFGFFTRFNEQSPESTPDWMDKLAEELQNNSPYQK